jgi:hypothetical protein
MLRCQAVFPEASKYPEDRDTCSLTETAAVMMSLGSVLYGMTLHLAPCKPRYL